jgi:hypothetical protein
MLARQQPPSSSSPLSIASRTSFRPTLHFGHFISDTHRGALPCRPRAHTKSGDPLFLFASHGRATGIAGGTSGRAQKGPSPPHIVAAAQSRLARLLPRKRRWAGYPQRQLERCTRRSTNRHPPNRRRARLFSSNTHRMGRRLARQISPASLSAKGKPQRRGALPWQASAAVVHRLSHAHISRRLGFLVGR